MAPPAFVRAVSCGVYQGSMRSAIHAMKYQGLIPVARELGRRLAIAIAQFSSSDQMLVIPVPLHRRRQKTRGFNQAHLVAREAVSNLRRTHPAWKLTLATELLQRQRATESQSGLTPRQRRLNLRGVFFAPNEAAVQGRHVLLVDDILTTGATARACSKVLMAAGAASVRVATVARAQRQFPRTPADDRTYINLPGRANFAPATAAGTSTTSSTTIQ
jgi:ComF family protein